MKTYKIRGIERNEWFKEISETDDYLRTVKSDLLENVLGKIMFQLDKCTLKTNPKS